MSTQSDLPMPSLFIGHGNPMNAIEDTEFSRAWVQLGKSLPRPQAILCISAHWETTGARVTAMERPRTIHDFRGFPRPLFEKAYPAPGSPALAGLVMELAAGTNIQADHGWGLDHGAWSVLCRMFPEADIPVVQLALDQRLTPKQHYALGQALRPLRHQGVMILGSGNIVHNLGRIDWDESSVHDWAQRFDDRICTLILAGRHEPIIDYAELGGDALLSVPTIEHFLPLIYVLGTKYTDDDVSLITQKITLGSISMTSCILGSKAYFAS